MRIEPDRFFHLTYCTNIHPADGWPAVFENIRRIAPGLKARLSPSAPFGLGLRLSAGEATELLDGRELADFRAFLDREGLYVAIINGFPYGAFHGAPVKTNVYAPDWRDEARVQYTLDLIEILRQLVPEDIDGGVSTAPLSYKPWMSNASDQDWRTITTNIMVVAATLARIHRDGGPLLHLDIEPEPDCLLENTAETIAFFDRWLLRDGAVWLANRLGIGLEAARDAVREHIRVCFDCCHFAVEFEDPGVALDRFQAAGIRIGRVQLSSALRVARPADAAVAARLQPFVESTYLHQVVGRRSGPVEEPSPMNDGLSRFPDLDVALRSTPNAPADAEWRIHFHVPLFADRYDDLESTQDVVRQTLEAATRSRFTRHLEIETYTWDVLPPALKIDMSESITREYRWVLETLDAQDRRP
jgi:sugar phosphate isomerase/epimerase